jgi:hypothetical protein
VDTQPFSINIIELVSKRVLVRLKVADKGKGKNIIIGDPCMSNISQAGIAQKALERKTNKSGGAGARLNRVVKRSSLTRASRWVRNLRADGLALKQTGRLTQPDSLPMARVVGLHTKRGRGCKDKAHVTHMIG